MHPSVAEAAIVFSRTSASTQEGIGDTDHAFDITVTNRISSTSPRVPGTPAEPPLITTGVQRRRPHHFRRPL
jgi:hypothetical protein